MLILSLSKRLLQLLLVGAACFANVNVNAQTDPESDASGGGANAGIGANSAQSAFQSAVAASALGASAQPAGRMPAPIASQAPGSTQVDVSKNGDNANLQSSSRVRRPMRVLPPSQFQRFVQEATGKLLPVYGSELFEMSQAYSPDTALPAPAEYILGPGDEVRVQVWGAVDYSGSHIIDRNGQINLPKVGAFTLTGVPVRDLESVLRSQLGKVFANFSVNANLGRLRSIQIYIVGQAQQPGTYTVSSLSTMINALFVSGGPTTNGSMRNIQLKRAGKTITTIDLYDFIAKGDKGRDIPLQSGDVIVIPPVGARVAVAGALDHAAIYELKPDSASGRTTVKDILSLGGGVPTLAGTRKALIERIDSTQSAPRKVQDIVLNAQGLVQTLQDGDVLTLLPISPAFANAVTLQGTVAEPLRYRWFEGMKILDLIPDREALITSDYYKRKNMLVQRLERDTDVDVDGKLLASDAVGVRGRARDREAGSKVADRVRGMVDQINWDYAVIERMDRNKLSTVLVPFNLGKAVIQQDPLHNLPLQAGDVVTILSQRDLRLPQDRQTRLVRVEGEVGAPGVYQVQPGETLPQLLQRIGGLTPQAYLFGMELSRESIRVRQQQNLESLVRKLESQLQAQASTVNANLGADRAAQAQVSQQQQHMQLKSQIDRLKTVNSNGRLALELDTQVNTLAAIPDLPLEDGDRVVVPAMPGYVSAFGSVNNENVFIYKTGKTVGDVLKSAGLTEDAEPDQAFVLRADGSIIARRDRSGFFSGGFESVHVMPGDTVVVPAQIDRESRYNFVTRALKDWTQIFSNFGLGVAALKTIKAL